MSLLGWLTGADDASDAAREAGQAQAAATDRATRLQRDMFNVGMAYREPYIGAGYPALGALAGMAGLGGGGGGFDQMGYANALRQYQADMDEWQSGYDQAVNSAPDMFGIRDQIAQRYRAQFPQPTEPMRDTFGVTGGGGTGDMMGGQIPGGYTAPGDLADYLPTSIDFANDPVYQQAAQQAEAATNRRLAAGGNLNSSAGANVLGRTLGGMAYDYGRDVYNRDYSRGADIYGARTGRENTQYGRLFDLANIGNTASGSASNAAQGLGANLGNLYSQQGQNQAQNALYQGQLAQTYSPFNLITGAAGAIAPFYR